MSIHQEIAADAAEIFTAFGKEIRWGGQMLPALISEPQAAYSIARGTRRRIIPA